MFCYLETSYDFLLLFCHMCNIVMKYFQTLMVTHAFDGLHDIAKLGE